MKMQFLLKFQELSGAFPDYMYKNIYATVDSLIGFQFLKLILYPFKGNLVKVQNMICILQCAIFHVHSILPFLDKMWSSLLG